MSADVTTPRVPVWVSDNVRAQIVEARDGHPDWGVEEIYNRVRWYGGFATHDEIRTVLAELEAGRR